MDTPILLAVPNVSEGRDEHVIAALRRAFAGGAAPHASEHEGSAEARSRARLLDVHSDRDHHRSVFTLAGPPRALADAVLAGARVAVERIDVMTGAGAAGRSAGQHPCVGALDVAPIVYLDERSRGAALAEALVVADRIGQQLEVPVFLYGELTADADRAGRSRAELRRGGPRGLAQRMCAIGSAAAPAHDAERLRLMPDFGPARMHPSAGATLVAARPPLVAFNLELAPPATLRDAQQIAAAIRDGGSSGLPGVRAIAIALSSGAAQVSMNVERPLEVRLATLVGAVADRAPIATAELVGLAPRAALDGFPADLELVGFDARRHVIENALGC